MNEDVGALWIPLRSSGSRSIGFLGQGRHDAIVEKVRRMYGSAVHPILDLTHGLDSGASRK